MVFFYKIYYKILLDIFLIKYFKTMAFHTIDQKKVKGYRCKSVKKLGVT